MPIFICDKCDALDNTACGGTYWGRFQEYFGEENVGKALCVECAPTKFSDGSDHKRGGKWHNRFKKEIMTEEKVTKYGVSNFIYLGKFDYLRTDKMRPKIHKGLTCKKCPFYHTSKHWEGGEEKKSYFCEFLDRGCHQKGFEALKDKVKLCKVNTEPRGVIK